MKRIPHSSREPFALTRVGLCKVGCSRRTPSWNPGQRGPSGGFSLIETLVVIAILCISLAIPITNLPRLLATDETRSGAQVVQASLAYAQVGALYQGGRARTVVAPSRTINSTGSHTRLELISTGALPSCNVARWRSSDGITVSFMWPFGSPDSAGSIILGGEGPSEAVVVRAETGLTRRERR